MNSWEKVIRPIPDKRLEQLEQLFKIPKEYFDKELEESDKLVIQKIKIENEMEVTYYKGTILDQETGEKIEIIEEIYDTEGMLKLQELNYKVKEKELHKKIKYNLDKYFNKELPDEGLNDAEAELNLYTRFIDIISDEKVNKDVVQKILKAIEVAYIGGFVSNDEFIEEIKNCIIDFKIKIK